MRIDSVLGFDAASACVDRRAAEQIAAIIRSPKLLLEWVVETHVHADHLGAAQYFGYTFGARVGIGDNVRDA